MEIGRYIDKPVYVCSLEGTGNIIRLQISPSSHIVKDTKAQWMEKKMTNPSEQHVACGIQTHYYYLYVFTSQVELPEGSLISSDTG